MWADLWTKTKMCENNYTKAQRNYSAHKSDEWSYKQKTGILINKP